MSLFIQSFLSSLTRTKYRPGCKSAMLNSCEWVVGINFLPEMSNSSISKGLSKPYPSIETLFSAGFGKMLKPMVCIVSVFAVNKLQLSGYGLSSMGKPATSA